MLLWWEQRVVERMRERWRDGWAIRVEESDRATAREVRWVLADLSSRLPHQIPRLRHTVSTRQRLNLELNVETDSVKSARNQPSPFLTLRNDVSQTPSSTQIFHFDSQLRSALKREFAEIGLASERVE